MRDENGKSLKLYSLLCDLTFDIVETGSCDAFAEVDERPLRLTAREDVVVVGHSDDSMGCHGRYLL